MGVARTAVSPDGRVWTVEKVRERLSLAERSREPFFWSSIAMTVILLAVIVRLVMVDPVSPMMLMFVIPLAVIWLLERGTWLFRPRIQAQTKGPPRERVVWKTGHPLGTRFLMKRAIKAIESGRPVTEPRGLRIVQLDAGVERE